MISIGTIKLIVLKDTEAAQCSKLLASFWLRLGTIYKWLIATLFAVGIVMAAVQIATAGVAIPRVAYAHKSALIRSGHAFWGLDAPIATFAAQIHTESRWRGDAVSPVGAQGLAQFMPATARDMAKLSHLRENTPFDTGWSIRALVTYDRQLWKQVSAVDDCHRMAKTLASYNGGLGWVWRDEKLARQQGKDASLYFGVVENVNAGRRASAKKENRAYPRRILFDYEPVYIKAGFGQGMCHE